MKKSFWVVLMLVMGSSSALAGYKGRTRGYLVEARGYGRAYLGITNNNEWKEIPASSFSQEQLEVAERCMKDRAKDALSVEYEEIDFRTDVRGVQCVSAPDFLYYWEEVTKLWHDAN